MRLIRTLVVLFFFGIISKVNAEVTISFEDIGTKIGKVAFGFVNNKLVTNFDNEGHFQRFYWKDIKGLVISKQAYLYEDKLIGVNEIAFCINQGGASRCSGYETLRGNEDNRSIDIESSNIGHLFIRFTEPDGFAIDQQPISLTELDLLSGHSSFIYTAHLDQDGSVLSSQLVKEVDKTYLEGDILTDEQEIQACSLAGFVASEPTYIEGCTPFYEVEGIMPPLVNNTGKGCIVSLISGDKYCLSPGQRSGYHLPDWIYAHPVYIDNDRGVKVMLSDWDNLSYNRIATFEGTVINQDLKRVKAKNGEYLDFSHPKSMRVLESRVKLGCIHSLREDVKYCLPVGLRSDYSLPGWIYNHEVYLDNDPDTKVMLSDWDNLSYNRIATFDGSVTNDKLKRVKARNGEHLDFSRPKSMRVQSSDTKLGCIYSIDSQAQFCLPPGERSNYGLPKWIYNKPVLVVAGKGVSVLLSDWDNLSYNRIARFEGKVSNEDLKDVQAYNGEYLDFSRPKSMRVMVTP